MQISMAWCLKHRKLINEGCYVSLYDFYNHLSQVSFLDAKDPRMTDMVFVF